jgi:hypothetical protein
LHTTGVGDDRSNLGSGVVKEEAMVIVVLVVIVVAA